MSGPVRNVEDHNEQKIKTLEDRFKTLEKAFGDLQAKVNQIRVSIKEEGEAAEYVVIEDKRPSVKQIKEVVGIYFDLTNHDIDSARRTSNVTYPRQLVMYLCRTLTLRSFPEIGRLLGRRDHTTILHGHAKIARLIKQDWTVAYDIAMIEKLL